jgi:lipoprotein-releasing system permease protein
MPARAPLFLAFRYLRPRRSFVSVITVISVLGIAVGVLMMVVVRAVMLGFEADFRATLMGAEPHVLLAAGAQAPAEPDWRAVLERVRARPETVSAAPYAGGMLYLAAGDQQTGAQTFGLESAGAQPVLAKLARHLLGGDLKLAPGTIVLPDYQAGELGVDVGDEISVYAGDNVNAAVREYSRANEEADAGRRRAILEAIRLNPQTLVVAGLLRSETGGYNAYVSLETGRRLFRLDGQGVSGLAVELAEPEAATGYRDLLQPGLPGWEFTLWTDAGEARLAAMRNEQTMMQFVLSIIALVAAFSVMNTTITVTTQKRREIGVLAALGCRRGQILGIFLNQAGVVGLLGTGLGLGGSLLVLWLRDDLRALLAAATGGQVHAVEGVFLATIPALVRPGDVVLTCLTSLGLCLLAGLIPAWFAARVDPAVALRD